MNFKIYFPPFDDFKRTNNFLQLNCEFVNENDLTYPLIKGSEVDRYYQKYLDLQFYNYVDSEYFDELQFKRIFKINLYNPVDFKITQKLRSMIFKIFDQSINSCISNVVMFTFIEMILKDSDMLSKYSKNEIKTEELIDDLKKFYSEYIEQKVYKETRNENFLFFADIVRFFKNLQISNKVITSSEIQHPTTQILTNNNEIFSLNRIFQTNYCFPINTYQVYETEDDRKNKNYVQVEYGTFFLSPFEENKPAIPFIIMRQYNKVMKPQKKEEFPPDYYYEAEYRILPLL